MKRTESIKTITPAEASRLLKFNNFMGQRNIREQHVAELGEKMKDGRFHIGSVALVDIAGTTYLADGQHQCSASVASKTPFKAVVQEYHLNGEDDPQAMARVFSQFNVDKGRTRGDVAWIYACQLGWEEWPRKLIVTAASALSAVASGVWVDNPSISKDQAAALLAENQKFCEWLNTFEFIHHKHLRRAPTIAAMAATFRKSQKAAEEFWVAVRDGDGLSKRDARLTLREYLKDNSLQGGAKNLAGRNTAERRGMYVKCIHAWNAWRDDRPTQLKYHPSAPTPKPV